MFGSVAKWAAQIDRPERVPEYVAHAYRTALSGRPGPVVLALPEDMLTSHARVADPPRVSAVACAPAADLVAEAHAMLARARAPLVIAGGSRWDREACAALERLAQATTATPITRATSASRSTPGSRRACATPTCSW
jgi:acetolactate synthase-1/2/3 large subunit